MCPIIFILFYDRDLQGEVSKVMINENFLVLLVPCPTGFNLLCDRVHHGGMLKLITF